MKDVFGKDATELKNKRLWLFDMDGTICEEESLFAGALDLLNLIKQIGGQYVFITNNSSKSVVDYINKVNRLGIEADENNFFTSAQATLLWLQNHMPKAKVYCQGTKSLLYGLYKAGVRVTEKVEDVDVVLVGFDTELSSVKIRNTCEILSTQKVKYIATNPDYACPVSFGFVPDCGAICEMIRHATGAWPQFIGKPEPVMVNIVREKMGYEADDVCVVGDRLYTDIATGINAGVSSICVLTGEATQEEIERSNLKPTYTMNSVLDIYNTVFL